MTEQAGAVALAARSLTASAGAWPILHGVDVALPVGRWCAIVGPNGAGKSTLLKALAGVRPASGQVQLLGRPWADWPVRERARRLAWLGQNESAADDLRVRDVVMLGRLPHQGWLAPPTADDRAAVAAAVRAVRVEDFVDRTLGQLSGGERQRVLLARALATGADVLLMDEPLANLDPPHQADWVALVRAQVAQGRTVISVLHELSVALLADDLLIVRGGRVMHHGASRDAATQRALEAVFDERVAVRQVDGHPVVLPRIVLDACRATPG